ncbi:hypothetical protein NEOKW01_1004 [Nematocida sp. AWRm80]|nr:hypothetical protein NEOKW01_1004 [Nematocida sp. AWRm80]
MQVHYLVQSYIDKTIGYPKERWAFFLFVLVLFFWRVVLTGGYRLVTYCLALYLLHCFIGFCSPIDSEMPDPFDTEEHEPVNVQINKSGDESKPFIRRLPEFEYWWLSLRASLLSLVCTLFPIFNIPVFTPILFFYFLGLAFLTGIKIKRHMKKYKYNPFFNAKKIYKNLVDR